MAFGAKIHKKNVPDLEGMFCGPKGRAEEWDPERQPVAVQKEVLLGGRLPPPPSLLPLQGLAPAGVGWARLGQAKRGLVSHPEHKIFKIKLETSCLRYGAMLG